MRKAGLFIGLKWAGVGPEEMAEATNLDSSILWDLTSRRDRILMNSPISDLAATWRINKVDSPRAWIVVTSPHRLSLNSAMMLKKKSSKLIALLGDNPVGSRAIRKPVLNLFDVVCVADGHWVESLSDARIPLLVHGWGSTITEKGLITANLIPPETLAVVGSPYNERVAMVEAMSKHFPMLTIGNWPAVGQELQLPSSSRLETIATLRSHKALVLNMHHTQFVNGLNPQFYDYASAAVPQVVWHMSRGFSLPNNFRIMPEGAPMRFMSEEVFVGNLEAISEVRKNGMFATTLERLLS